MKDATLEVSAYLPAANATNATPPLDLHVDGDSFGNAWRLGKVRATIPAMPNHVNPALSITLTMQQQPQTGGAFANTQPVIQASIPGVANGTAAMTIDFPLPPALTGPIQFVQSVPAADGNNQGAQITYNWLNE